MRYPRCCRLLFGLGLTVIASAGWALSTEDGVAAARDGRFDEARKIWEEVADAAALRNLGGLHLSGVLGQPDFDAARGHFLTAADLGDAQAMLSLGYINARGMGQDKDAATAEVWFAKAAALDQPEGQFMLARTLLDRNRTDAETQDALDMLNLSAGVGYPPALVLVGDLLRSGTYTDQDVGMAVAYYQSAADAGAVDAMTKLGDVHLFAELGAPDIPAAVRHYLRAAENGATDAMYALAFLFYNDTGADQTLLQTAFNHAQTASLGWDERAQLLLGKMYLDGRATRTNYSEAYFWLDLAASAGVVEAHHLRALAHAQIGPEEAEKVHDRARTWFRENHTTPHVHRLLANNEHAFR